MQKLETDNATAYYDEETGIIHIIYRGILTGDTTISVYDWLAELYKEVDINSVYGQIFDFRKVQEFEQDNLTTARKTSNKMNMRVDTSNFPVALLVSDPYHQEILHGSMRISPQHQRKQVVWSEEEALDFLAKWHREHNHA